MHEPGAKLVTEVSVVMPCLNEAETIAECIERAHITMREQGIEGEVIIADNGSTDGSERIARGRGARVVKVLERGYGAALLGGIAAANGPLVVIADADGSYDLRELPKFVQALRAGSELVMGTRFPSAGGTIRPGAMPFLNRWLGTPVLSAVGRLFFSTYASDVNCGMRGFRKDAFDRLGLQMTGMEFASEMVVKAALLGLATAEVPITLHPAGRSRPPHLRRWRDGWRHLRVLLLFSPRWLFALPGAAMIAVGGIALARLLAGPVQVGNVVFSTNTMLVAAMALILGVQLVLLGILAKSFVVAERLLPGSKLDRIGKALRMESGLIVGLLFFLVGAGCVVWAVAIWRGTGFGPLVDASATRLVVLGITGMVLGVQVASAAFFLGVLALARKRPDVVSDG